MAKKTTYSSPRLQRKKKMLLSGIVFAVLVGAVLAGASQIQIVREFFGQASGTPANLVVNTTAVLGPVARPWRNLAQGGEDHAWRLQPLTAEVKSLHPEYIRIDHIYDFYDIVQGQPGNLSFDFSKLDLVLNDILATGAKPFISLSYMPPAIASGDIVSPPKNWADWQLTVQKTIEHISGTLGIEDVYYEVWNEPDLFGGWKYYGDKNYLTMYTYSIQGANKAQGVKPYKIGGPATTALYKNWFDALAKHAIDNNLRLDFFSWHRYTTDVDQYTQDITEVHTWIENYPQLAPTLEFHITEWGHNSENDPGYDTAVGAAHTVAGSITMSNWIQRAFIFEIQDGRAPENQAYWGRWGMFTHKDAGATAKPRYHALNMLESIGDQRLQITGLGSWVKAVAAKNTKGNPELVIVNYSAQGNHSENVPITFRNIEPGSFKLEQQFLSGRTLSTPVATTEATLKAFVNMAANDVAKVELVRTP
ncbi:hypothetical protein KC921_05485 [Candidatus Woesebacteria bacterium]|nr:hypothetical protein [Candidatus Woesebacteria bacterium]